MTKALILPCESMAFARQYQRFCMRLVYRMLCEVKEKVKDRTKQSLATKRREGKEGVIWALQFLRELSTDFRTWGDNPLQSTDYYIQRRPPSAPLKRNSDGGLTIWVYVCYALCLPMLIIQTAIVQKTLFITPTRLLKVALMRCHSKRDLRHALC